MALPVAEFLALEHGTEYWGAAAGVKHTTDGEVLPWHLLQQLLDCLSTKQQPSALAQTAIGSGVREAVAFHARTENLEVSAMVR